MGDNSRTTEKREFEKQMKIPKVEFKKLLKNRKVIGFLLIAAFVVTLSTAIRLGTDELDIVRPLFDNATGTYTVSVLGVPHTLESGETVSVLLNDLISINVHVQWTSTRNRPPQIQCKIMDSFYGIFYQDIAWSDVDSDDNYYWNFDLKDLPTGNYAYHFEFVGYYPSITAPTSIYDGQSFYFNIDKYAEQIPDAPSIIEEPADFDMIDDFSSELVWQYQYKDAGTISLSLDGVVQDTVASIESSAQQVYRWTFNPTENGDYVVKFELDPTHDGHATVESIVNVHVVSYEDYHLIEGLPSGVTCNIAVQGTISMLGLPANNVWDAANVAPVIAPLDGSMILTLHTASFTAAKLVIISPDGTSEELDLRKALLTWWNEIDLTTYEAGEYTFEVRCEHSGAWYRISTFTIAVRTIPYSFIVLGIGIFAALSIASVVLIKVLREATGWWGFKGKYNK